MALKGDAFLALWNDFDPSRDDEYNCWHTFEHVPERVGIDGVLSGRRYVAREREHWRYFTLYELEALSALAGARYMDVVDRPTAWSASMRPSFSNFVRRPCATAFSVGQGHGAAIATHRFALASAVDPLEWSGLLRPYVEAAVAVAIHVGRIDTSAKFPLGGAVAGPVGVPYVLLIEGTDRDQVQRAIAPCTGAIREAFDPGESMEGEVYDLALTVQKADLADRQARRQPERPELRAGWKPD